MRPLELPRRLAAGLLRLTPLPYCAGVREGLASSAPTAVWSNWYPQLSSQFQQSHHRAPWRRATLKFARPPGTVTKPSVPFSHNDHKAVVPLSGDWPTSSGSAHSCSMCVGTWSRQPTRDWIPARDSDRTAVFDSDRMAVINTGGVQKIDSHVAAGINLGVMMVIENN